MKLGLDLAVGCALAGTLQRKALPDSVREVLLTILGMDPGIHRSDWPGLSVGG